MKRIFVTLSSISALFFTSCDNENSTNLEPLGTITVNGAIYTEMDENEGGDPARDEKIPAGVSVYVLDEGTEDLLTTTLTTVEGYSFTLEIGAPRWITIVVGDFTADINVSDGAGGFETKAAIYNGRQPTDVFVVNGGTYIKNIRISKLQVINFD